MRSIFIFTLFLMSLSVPQAFARTAGVRMGWNYANVKKTNQSGSEVETNRNSGFYIAGTGEADLSSVFFFQGEVGFIQRGFSQTTASTETRYRANYLIIAPLLKAKMFSPTKLVPEFGPYFGFKTSEQTESQTGSTTTLLDQKQFGFFDFGLLLGLGFERPITGGTSLVGGFRYTMGIKDVDQLEATQTKHRGFLLFLGAQFTL